VLNQFLLKHADGFNSVAVV